MARSHGAPIDPRDPLAGVVAARSGAYTVSARALGTYVVSKRDTAVSKSSLYAGRGDAYTKSPVAYLFERVA